MTRNILYLLDVRPLFKKDKFDSCFKELDLERRQKVNRLKSIEAKALSLGAGLLLKKATQIHFQAEGWPEMILSDCGKPMFAGADNFFFNLSHSGHLAACGVGPKPLGVDVQKISQARISLAEKFFHQEESAFLKSLPENQRDNGFSQIWAAKESYIKYQGSGLGFPLNAFFIEFMVKSDRWEAVNCSQPGVYFKNYPLLDDYAVWFCSEYNSFEETAVWLEV
ncbi:4'-phosphopantetheinyl transferase superfamily protein [Eubacteriaceae bacterium ES2]|nr:4'-phosphopantetheinyl transferase superfamily protein [Eubacteriaceae bacterium ES2]